MQPDLWERGNNPLVAVYNVPGIVSGGLHILPMDSFQRSCELDISIKLRSCMARVNWQVQMQLRSVGPQGHASSMKEVSWSFALKSSSTFVGAQRPQSV